MNNAHEHHPDGAHVLVVDDDTFFCRILEQQLRQAGLRPHCVHSGNDLFEYLAERNPDLIILDYYLGKENGLALCRRLRRISSVPVIMLTGLKDGAAVVACLDSGADDYVVKPHDRDQLLARLRVLLRRSTENRASDSAAAALRFGDIELEPASRVLRRGMQQTQLSERECTLLQRLYAQYPAPLDRERASWIVLRRELKPGDRSIDLLISRIRKRLNGMASSVDVITLRNRGYLLRNS